MFKTERIHSSIKNSKKKYSKNGKEKKVIMI